ncbi:MAG: flagellar M-ring protein FliF [Proteobacteria bacterium]|nr:flagellar M-ring protein FliF [Pseudomonadota bacterium]MBU1710539.1 flagellar M-ring protein FliF [Pseudomonadota bacterium]
MANAKEMLEQIATIFKEFSVTQKIAFAVILVVVVGGLYALTTTGGNLQYKVLFSGMTQEDASDIVAKLQEQRHLYKLSNNGATILVPADKVLDIRLAMAGEGLPRGGGVGFEIFDKTSFGTTDFVHRLNYQRALQGELARTIRQFQQVEEARVHIAVSKESVFIEDEKPPSASVSVKLRGREKLSPHQIQSIVNLVASAVSGMTTDNITVVDTMGRLLYRKQGNEEGVITANQLEYQVKIEESLRQKVESMLEEVVGIDRVRAEVTAEMDFDRIELTEENFDPETQVVRSEQLQAEGDSRGGADAQGIPGVKGDLATYADSGVASGGSANYNRNNVTRNYEISKVTRHIRESVGSIKRLSVAVMVDGTYDKKKDDQGDNTLQYKSRTPEEMQRFDKLVKNAIGYNEDREDKVEVVNMSFALSSIVEPEVDPMDKWWDMGERFSMPAFYLIIVLGVFLLVLRPLLRILTSGPVARATRPLTGQRFAAVVGGAPGEEMEEEEDLTLHPKGMTDKEKIYRLAQSDPDRAADLVRRWLREEA